MGDLEEFHPDRMAGRILGMGDVVSLVEKAQENIDQAEALKLQEKLQKDELTLGDFLKQLQQMKKMGPLKSLMKMLPGQLGEMAGEIDEDEVKHSEAIIQSMTPAEAVPEGMQVQQRPKLEAKRVLVVADDKSVRNDAHALLARYGCIVETATNGDEAIYLVRNAGQEQRYDTIISDIILPDTDGYELMLRLKELVDPVPLILMTGFGYDPDHSIVRARRQGLHPGAVLYKPFRLGQLLDTVELIMDWQPDSDEA